MTATWLWIVLCGVPLLLVVAFVVRRRRAARAAAGDAVLRDARRAMAEMDRRRGRSRKGTIRGQGGGGNAGTMYDAAYGSDTSAGA
ncbi:hypothetical protein GA0070622_4220 [Micromonospora sediminicola]|uniref:Uncharacterized protein n=1 Tax=Micromonospora sediminicola TaxID=946078 RepID=A0A1A9BE69_9ACTN|nr:MULTISPECIES: hypothetical protein [Micromonospora]SBT67167.1 hypothetical protein GA0070622_4220 [Micromonospora sediminicola]